MPALYHAMQLALRPMTILVVEDELLIRMSSVATLEDAGFWVLEAQNSAEALAVLACHSEVSIMMTDVRMPGHINGLELVARVQIDHPTIRSIVVSGHTTAMDASNAGAIGFLPKPYMADTLLQAVRDTLKRH